MNPAEALLNTECPPLSFGHQTVFRNLTRELFGEDNVSVLVFVVVVAVGVDDPVLQVFHYAGCTAFLSPFYFGALLKFPPASTLNFRRFICDGAPVLRCTRRRAKRRGDPLGERRPPRRDGADPRQLFLHVFLPRTHCEHRKLCEAYVSGSRGADGLFSCTAARDGAGTLLAGGEPDFLYSELDKYILYFRQEEVTPVFVFDGFDPLAALPWETVQERVQRLQKRMAREREAQDAFWRGAATSPESVSSTPKPSPAHVTPLLQLSLLRYSQVQRYLLMKQVEFLRAPFFATAQFRALAAFYASKGTQGKIYALSSPEVLLYADLPIVYSVSYEVSPSHSPAIVSTSRPPFPHTVWYHLQSLPPFFPIFFSF